MMGLYIQMNGNILVLEYWSNCSCVTAKYLMLFEARRKMIYSMNYPLIDILNQEPIPQLMTWYQLVIINPGSMPKSILTL